MTEYFNILDEQNRFVTLRVYDNAKTGQSDSHTMSTLYVNQQIARPNTRPFEKLFQLAELQESAELNGLELTLSEVGRDE